MRAVLLQIKSYLSIIDRATFERVLGIKSKTMRRATKNNDGTLSVSGIEKIELYEGGVGDIVVLHSRLNGQFSKFKLIFD